MLSRTFSTLIAAMAATTAIAEPTLPGFDAANFTDPKPNP